MNYQVRSICYRNIFSFYHHVAKKYKHTYSKLLLHKNIDDAIDGMYRIEKDLPRRTPTINRWEGFFMAHCGHWYYAYTVNDNIVTIEDACHEQNMY